MSKIKTRLEHKNALGEIERLMDKASLDKFEEKKLDTLASRVEEYENIHYPIPKPDPAEAIKFRKEQESSKASGDSLK